MDFGPLRQRILQLAVSGQLVEQLDSEPAVKQIGLPPLSGEIPFEIPAKWKWVSLNYIAEYNPDVQANDDIEVSFVPLADLSSGYNCELAFKQVKPWGQVKKGYKRFQSGDVIFAKIHPSFQNRKSGLITIAHNGIGCGSTEFCVYRCATPLLNKYLLWFFKTEYFIELGKHTFKGTVGQQRVNLEVINSTYIPLPPIEEQCRIVAVVDDLMGRLDQMEAAYSEFAGPMTKHFRNLVLKQAFRGQLVPQDSSDTPVDGFSLPLGDYEIPDNWKWLPLNSLFLDSFSGGTPSKKHPEYWNGDIPWASIKDVKADSYELTETKDRITKAGLENSSTYILEPNNVIVGMRMGLGRAVINRIPVVINQDLRALYMIPHIIIPEYFVMYYKTLKIEGAGTTVKGITAVDLFTTMVPVPPIEEQHRIVAKVKELLAGAEKLGSLMEYA